MNDFYCDATLEALTQIYDAPKRTSVLSAMDTQGVRTLNYMTLFVDSPLQNMELEAALVRLARASSCVGFWVGIPMQGYTAATVALIEQGDPQLNGIGRALHCAVQERFCDIF